MIRTNYDCNKKELSDLEVLPVKWHSARKGNWIVERKRMQMFIAVITKNTRVCMNSILVQILRAQHRYLAIFGIDFSAAGA